VLEWQQPEASEWVQDYRYDLAGRMTGITSPAGAFGYTYNPGLAGTVAASSLIAKIALPIGAFITNTYDNNGRMLGTWLYNSSALALDSSVYANNVGSQRVSATRGGENTADYTYDKIGQVVADQAYEVTGGATRWNEQLHYAFDPAGNLTYRTNNTIVKNFQVNNLNELTGMTNGGRLTVMGTATSSNATTVTVNSSNALVYGDATFAATNMPLTTSYTAIAADSLGRHSTNTVTVLLSTNNALYQYDGNGNLTNDGTRSFAYDDENQLIQVWVAGEWFSQFSYDGKMRRRIRQEYTWQSSGWVQTNEVYYVYDGNTVIQERNINNLPTTTYTRGLDLSSSLQGAGGIGGLLAMTLNTAPGPSSSNSMYYHSDGNGNVTMLINPSQSIVAKYLYDAFGNVLSKSGILADVNLYRFSSKEAHLNSGLVYYLCRYYDPNLQRWLNRDPVEERGGLNLYGFVRNNPITRTDLRGLGPCDNYDLWDSWEINEQNYDANGDLIGTDPNTQMGQIFFSTLEQDVISGYIAFYGLVMLGPEDISEGWATLSEATTAAETLNGTATVIGGINTIDQSISKATGSQQNESLETASNILDAFNESVNGVTTTISKSIYDVATWVNGVLNGSSSSENPGSDSPSGE
jgi:RHS repeat-associated protein